MLANVFLDRRNRRRRQQELPHEQPQEIAEPRRQSSKAQAASKTSAAEFERRLCGKTTEAAVGNASGVSSRESGVVHDGTRVRRDDGSRVHRDGEASG